VTPEIAARLRRGEQVSPEEIEQASARAISQKSAGDVVQDTGVGAEKDSSQTGDSEPNEWLPDTITRPKRRTRSKKT